MPSDDVLSRIEEHLHVLPLGEKSLDFGKILSTDTSVRILEAAYQSDSKVGVSAAEISGLLGLGRTTVLYHLGRMQESGLLQVNPVLQSEDSWQKFWNLYRSRDANVEAKQFNKLHHARMNGIKLFVPTKRGFLVLPSTDLKESRSMMGEVLATITNLALERDYGRMRKTTALLGSIGVMLILFSFLLELPFFQGVDFGTGPPFYGAQRMQELDLQSATPGITPPLESPESDLAGKSASAAPAAESVEAAGPAADKTPVKDSEKTVDMTVSTSPPLTMSGPDRYVSSNRLDLVSKGFLLAGILFLGSFLGLFIYSRRQAARIHS